MKIQNAHERLNYLWGEIDRKHNEIISSKVLGKRVLDVGCGYGSLTHFLTELGFEAEGWDTDEESLSVARKLFPKTNFKLINLEKVDPATVQKFDSIILKDCLHHLVGEGDPEVSFEKLKSLLHPKGRLVIWDPNPHWILRAGRRLIFHHDPKASPSLAVQLLESNHFDVRGVEYYESIGLLLSGGYVGIRWIPNWSPLNYFVTKANDVLSRFLIRTGAARFFCFRYLISADLK